MSLVLKIPTNESSLLDQGYEALGHSSSWPPRESARRTDLLHNPCVIPVLKDESCSPRKLVEPHLTMAHMSRDHRRIIIHFVSFASSMFPSLCFERHDEIIKNCRHWNLSQDSSFVKRSRPNPLVSLSKLFFVALDSNLVVLVKIATSDFSKAPFTKCGILLVPQSSIVTGGWLDFSCSAARLILMY